jgi:hypothetical protein
MEGRVAAAEGTGGDGVSDEATIFRLHLNGGPRDDSYIDHWMTTFEVAAVRGGLDTILDSGEVPTVATRTGQYRLRLDDNGDPVPHNLQGFVEADWQGWT